MIFFSFDRFRINFQAPDQIPQLLCLVFRVTYDFKMIEPVRIADRTGGQKSSTDKSSPAAILLDNHVVDQRKILCQRAFRRQQLDRLQDTLCLLYTSFRRPLSRGRPLCLKHGGRGERRMEGIKPSTGLSPVPLESGLRKS